MRFSLVNPLFEDDQSDNPDIITLNTYSPKAKDALNLFELTDNGYNLMFTPQISKDFINDNIVYFINQGYTNPSLKWDTMPPLNKLDIICAMTQGAGEYPYIYKNKDLPDKKTSQFAVENMGEFFDDTEKEIKKALAEIKDIIINNSKDGGKSDNLEMLEKGSLGITYDLYKLKNSLYRSVDKFAKTISKDGSSKSGELKNALERNVSSGLSAFSNAMGLNDSDFSDGQNYESSRDFYTVDDPDEYDLNSAENDNGDGKNDDEVQAPVGTSMSPKELKKFKKQKQKEKEREQKEKERDGQAKMNQRVADRKKQQKEKDNWEKNKQKEKFKRPEFPYPQEIKSINKGSLPRSMRHADEYQLSQMDNVDFTIILAFAKMDDKLVEKYSDQKVINSMTNMGRAMLAWVVAEMEFPQKGMSAQRQEEAAQEILKTDISKVSGDKEFTIHFEAKTVVSDIRFFVRAYDGNHYRGEVMAKFIFEEKEYGGKTKQGRSVAEWMPMEKWLRTMISEIKNNDRY